jgi:uncharacterized membrane protein YesL
LTIYRFNWIYMWIAGALFLMGAAMLVVDYVFYRTVCGPLVGATLTMAWLSWFCWCGSKPSDDWDVDDEEWA